MGAKRDPVEKIQLEFHARIPYKIIWISIEFVGISAWNLTLIRGSIRQDFECKTGRFSGPDGCSQIDRCTYQTQKMNLGSIVLNLQQGN